MVWFASPLAGYLCDRFSCRITTFLGGLLCASGLVTTSFVQSLTHMYFTYSLILGLGACFIYNACYLVIGQYFEKKTVHSYRHCSIGGKLGRSIHRTVASNTFGRFWMERKFENNDSILRGNLYPQFGFQPKRRQQYPKRNKSRK